MVKKTWTYKLRLLGRNPSRVPMARLAEYMIDFAELLGKENLPVFKGVRRGSTCLLAAIPETNRPLAKVRISEAKTMPASRPARVLANIETKIGADGLTGGELIDSDDNVVYLFKGSKPVVSESFVVEQSGEIDGVVVGIVGADDTLHVTFRDWFGREFKLTVKDLATGQQLASRFRSGMVRCYARGKWRKQESGWLPDSTCQLDQYVDLDESPVKMVFDNLRDIKGNGWSELEDPIAEWQQVRGIH
jgi:hypothetical protein